MENEVKESVNLAVSIIAISLIIVVAVIFSDLSYRAYNYKIKTDSTNYRIKTQSELYNYFINPNSDVSGADILDFITVYDKAYKYVIVTDTGAYWLSNRGLLELTTTENIGDLDESDILDNTETANDSMWTQTYITENILGEKIYSKYDGSIIKATGEVVEDVTEVNGDVWLKFEIKN